MVVVRGKFEKDEESARIVASEVLPITVVRETISREVAIHLTWPPHNRTTLEALSEVLSKHRGDRRLLFELEIRTIGGRPLRVRADVPQLRVRPSERLVADVERLCGAGSVALR